ncbi:MAG: PIG-L family deacetylase [Candidatus Marinimicrobia bacterium]|nr:PIG-L family deacetylase [Candidatus Neomarinimicrobiota bacterium]
MIRRKLILVSLSLILFNFSMKLKAEIPNPDPRMKSDILLIVPHPDDETAIGSYLAKAVFDDDREVAAVYTNRGSGGGNSYGWQQSTAMGLIRENEVRQALAEFGIHKVWFLDGKDTPGQDVLHSLKTVNHGSALEHIIRIIRLTRPEVIISWLPCFVAGENHGDHQAAGVLATEAFDMAANPTIFPAQVAVPREVEDINNHMEGLSPWQPKKLYFYSDRDEPFPAPGPDFDMEAMSPTKNKPYYQLAARLHKHHLTQGDVSDMALKAAESGKWQPFIDWLEKFNLIFGKAVVPCQPTDPVFKGIDDNKVTYQAPPGYSPKKTKGIHLKMGGVFDFYHKFWQAHGLEHLAGRISPEMMVAFGSYVHIPLIIENNTESDIEVYLKSYFPSEWQVLTENQKYYLKAGEVRPVQTFAFAPDEDDSEQELGWKLSTENREPEEINIKVKLTDWALPQ